MKKLLPIVVLLFLSAFVYSQEKVNLSVTIEFPSNIDANAVTVTIPKLKYDKKVIFSYTSDDANAEAYGKAFRVINKKWVDNAAYFHVGQETTTGYTPTKTLGYTDGCGNERRMPIGAAIWPNNSNANIKQFMDREREGSGYRYMLWQDLIPILDFGGSPYFHDVNNYNAWNDNNKNDIIKGFAEDQQKTWLKTGRKMKVLMRPGNNNVYIDAAKEYEDIVMSWAGGAPAEKIYPNDEPTLLNTVGARYIDNMDVIQKMTEAYNKENPEWYHWATHGITSEAIQALTQVSDTWGKGGSDIAWMATVDEVYEYLYMRKNTTITKKVDGNKLTINLAVSTDKNFYFKDLSLVVNGGGNPTQITVSDRVETLSWKASGNKTLVNVGFDSSITSRAEKYTRLYEVSGKGEDKDDALYFVNQLKPDLQKAFLNRINSGKRITPIALANVAFNKGVEFSLSTDAYFEATPDQTPTHYRVGETVDLATQEWKPWTGGKMPFTLSSPLGYKIAYVQVKNATNESQIYSGSLQLLKSISMPQEGLEILASLTPTSLPGNNIQYEKHNGKTVNLMNAHYKELTLQTSKGEELCTYFHNAQRYPGSPGYNQTGEYPDISNNQTGYPLEWVNHCLYYMEYHIPEVIVPNRLVFMVPNGKYQVRIFGSSKNAKAANYNNLFYEVNGQRKTPKFSMRNNGKDFLVFDDVVVDNSHIIIKYWSDSTRDNMAPINFIEMRSKSYITGIDKPAVAEEGLNIISEKGKLIISSRNPQTVSLYTISGMLLGKYQINESDTEIEVEQGIYIVNDQKILVP